VKSEKYKVPLNSVSSSFICLQPPWFEILSSVSCCRIFSKYLRNFDVNFSKCVSDFNLWTSEVLGRVRTKLANTQCVVCPSDVLVLFMKHLVLKSFLTGVASPEGKGVGGNKCHWFSWKVLRVCICEYTACGLWLIFYCCQTTEFSIL
jgi:hypothetical protein